jgi:hypothetical protein
VEGGMRPIPTLASHFDFSLSGFFYFAVPYFPFSIDFPQNCATVNRVLARACSLKVENRKQKIEIGKDGGFPGVQSCDLA